MRTMRESRLYTIRRKAFEKQHRRRAHVANMMFQEATQSIVAKVNEILGENDESANQLTDRMN